MPPSISPTCLPIVFVVLPLGSLLLFTVMFTTSFLLSVLLSSSFPFLLLFLTLSLCLLPCSSLAWPSSIVGMCHWPTCTVGDEVYCCGLEASSSSGVGGGQGSNCGTALPLIAAIGSNPCPNLKEVSQDSGGPRQASISWTFPRIVLLA